MPSSKATDDGAAPEELGTATPLPMPTSVRSNMQPKVSFRFDQAENRSLPGSSPQRQVSPTSTRKPPTNEPSPVGGEASTGSTPRNRVNPGTGGAEAGGVAQFGRRAAAKGQAQEAGGERSSRGSRGDPGDEEGATLMFSGNELANANSSDEAELQRAAAEAEARSKEREEQLRLKVAEAPVEYHSVMPKLIHLDTAGRWSNFLHHINQEFDMTCLTTCLASELDDEDVPWNLEMLLVQLTSDLRSEVEQRDEKGIDEFGSDGSGGKQERRTRGTRRLYLETDGIENEGGGATKGAVAEEADDGDEGTIDPSDAPKRHVKRAFASAGEENVAFEATAVSPAALQSRQTSTAGSEAKGKRSEGPSKKQKSAEGEGKATISPLDAGKKKKSALRSATQTPKKSSEGDAGDGEGGKSLGSGKKSFISKLAGGK